ncbi:MAG: hypothetical protein IKJ56_04380 [Bacteroidales bacterium]|nr:hypothetical protein [Bacteroidales bacterium]
MKKVLLIISMVAMFAAMTSCEADDETYNSFIGDWHLVRINANGEYRLPRPNADTCFNLHFFTNNSMIGESVQSTFSSVYNIRKKNKIEFSGFYYIPVSEDSTDNVVFMENILMADSYSMKEDTLKFMSDKKAYLLFVRR